MTTEYPYGLAQLAQILSALENERRNPNTKRNAIKAIERAAREIGLTAADVFDAADGLLSGRLSATDWRAQLRDEHPDPGQDREPATTEQAVAAEVDGAAAVKRMLDGLGEPTATGVHDIPDFLRREAPAEPAEPEPERPLVLPARSQAKPRKRREGSKQALMIEMLKRPEGATIAQIMHETGWLAHTCRGAMAGALKKKLGLTITSEKSEGGARTYRIAE